MSVKNHWYTSSHLLSEIKSFQTTAAGKRGPMAGTAVAVNTTEKCCIHLESRRGVFQKARMVPSGLIHMEMAIIPNNEIIQWNDVDHRGWEAEDFGFARMRVSSAEQLKDFDRMVKAMELCREAIKIEAENPRRMSTIEQALQMSPKHCAMAYFLKFEILSVQGKFDLRDRKSVDKAVEILTKGSQAGKNSAEMMRADSFCPGKLYSWMPTRWYVRCTYLLGALLLSADRYNEADLALKQCLAVDVHDKLGARHKQLLTVLLRDGIQGEEIQYLLAAKFGEDQEIDDVYALFNYTRALRTFCDKGDCKKSRKLLEYAIEKNDKVPSLLLAWESSKQSPELMILGGEMEATDYAADNSIFWIQSDGALDWMENVYCKVKSIEPLTTHPEIRKLLIQANLLIEDTNEKLHTAKRKRIKTEALEKLERIEELLLQETTAGGSSCSGGSSSSRSKELKMLLYQRKGFCYVELFDFVKALPCFNTALSLCDLNDKDTVKELLYNRADCKQQSGDLVGALSDFTFVFQRIGAFSTAYENIQKLERQLNVNASRSVLPPPVPVPDVDVDGDAETVRKAMANLSLHMPAVNLADRTPERCSHCQRGGMKLAGCSACKSNEDKYCSKQCQVASWKTYHKYVCKGSKNHLDAGTKVTIQGLEKTPQHNGKNAIVVKFLPDSKRFVIQICADDENDDEITLSVKPQNLSKMQ